MGLQVTFSYREIAAFDRNVEVKKNILTLMTFPILQLINFSFNRLS